MKKITFRPIDNNIIDIVPSPKPSKKYIPEWFKKIDKFYDKKNIIDDNSEAKLTIKSCMPFLDSLMSGYIQETWTDIYIEVENENIKYVCPSEPYPIMHREKNSFFNIPEYYYPVDFLWKPYWIPQLPKGYSMLYVHPLNRIDLPFTTLEGIVDNDLFYMERSPTHPFFIKKTFSGIIPKGTPMYQMIPVKRNHWFSQNKKNKESINKKFFNIRQHFYDGYKKEYWNLKKYE